MELSIQSSFLDIAAYGTFHVVDYSGRHSNLLVDLFVLMIGQLTPFFNNLPDTATLILLLSVIVTMLLSELVVFLVVSLHSRDSGSSSTSAKGHRLSTVLIAPPSDNDSSSNKIVKDCDKSPLDVPKFDVIVSDNASSNQLNVQKL
ncbi:unnamed protein product [Anisakis simplex]|uniref:Neur_chan_memb domain-containing protein n=1 Tax=Anisakis simplex TaxID=6269 RepID=A0A0M3J235_ANISI|nr:unnamed protein product [Anisakis simplex]